MIPDLTKRLWLAFGILLNLGLLIYFKYWMPAVSLLNRAFPDAGFSARKMVLPIGISFYTFRSISYLIDLFRGEVVPQKSWIDFSLYKKPDFFLFRTGVVNWLNGRTWTV